jgi:hypothetical protein
MIEFVNSLLESLEGEVLISNWRKLVPEYMNDSTYLNLNESKFWPWRRGRNQYRLYV